MTLVIDLARVDEQLLVRPTFVGADLVAAVPARAVAARGIIKINGLERPALRVQQHAAEIQVGDFFSAAVPFYSYQKVRVLRLEAVAEVGVEALAHRWGGPGRSA